jgi:hypothetical protein
MPCRPPAGPGRTLTRYCVGNFYISGTPLGGRLLLTQRCSWLFAGGGSSPRESPAAVRCQGPGGVNLCAEMMGRQTCNITPTICRACRDLDPARPAPSHLGFCLSRCVCIGALSSLPYDGHRWLPCGRQSRTPPPGVIRWIWQPTSRYWLFAAHGELSTYEVQSQQFPLM